MIEDIKRVENSINYHVSVICIFVVFHPGLEENHSSKLA